MTKYNYREAIKNDIRDHLTENHTAEEIRAKLTDNRDAFEEELNDSLWIDDSVTGNASGSYTFNTYQAEEYIAHNLGLLAEALQEFGSSNADILAKGAEWCDVTIRCYLLSECIASVLDEYV